MAQMTKSKTDKSAQSLMLKAFAAYERQDISLATTLCDEVLAASSEQPDAWMLRGVLYRRAGDIPAAVRAYSKAITLKPDYLEAWMNLGNIHASGKQWDAAARAYEQVLRIKPDHLQGWSSLGRLCIDQHDFSRGLNALRQALALQPGYLEAGNLLGWALCLMGHPQEALPILRRALLDHPGNAVVLRNQLLALACQPDAEDAEMAAALRNWLAANVGKVTRLTLPAPIPREGRRLRVAYVCSRFGHIATVGFGLAPFLHHNRKAFQVFAYHDGRQGGGQAERFRAEADVWRETWALDDKSFCEQVIRDQIDVLVDMSGPMEGRNRLLALACKPAPVQVSWLGRLATTALPTMDVIVGDLEVCLANSEPFMSEAVLRMPFGFTCWEPPEERMPPTGKPPALASGHITFGSFNPVESLNDAVIRLWASILSACPASRLVCKAAAFVDGFVRRDVEQRFAVCGISRDRLDLQQAPPYQSLMKSYQGIDIALDPFPLSGKAAACDALWMGLPVLTLRGERSAQNHTASVLVAAGFGEWVANTEAEYRDRALAWVADIEQLRVWRSSLRDILPDSPLCGGEFFTRHLEIHYRRLWDAWASSQEIS